MGIGVYNIYNLVEIIKQTQIYTKYGLFKMINCWIGDHAYFISIAVVVLGILSVFGITIIEEIKRIKWKKLKKLLGVLFLISITLSLILMVYGTMFKLSISIEDKTRYEFVTDDGEYVILSTYEDKLLVVPFEINENGQYIFKTYKYLFKDPYDVIYRYVDIEHTPQIQFNEE